MKADADGHFCRTTAGCEDRVEVDIARDGEGVGEVTIYFVEDVF